MKKVKSALSLFLSAVMLSGMIPVGMMNVSAAPQENGSSLSDYTDIDMDFNYPYTDPKVVLNKNMDLKAATLSSKDNGTIKWKHATSFSPQSGNFRDYLESTSDDDKYILVDNDLTTTSGHTDYETIVIRSDKILDLNGHLIRLMDKRNKVDTHDDYSDKYYQSDNSSDFQSVMFSIENGATLTIIDSSAEQTGEIYTHAYMIDPYAHRIKRYTTRDIFNVPDGNLVIYGGTYQAGRSKAQTDDDLFNKLETVVGNAVALATDIAGYATGINAATGAYEDAVFNANQAMEAIKKAGGNSDSDASAKDQNSAATKKKDGTDAQPEQKTATPEGKETGDAARNKTVSEKQNDKDKNKKNESNQNRSAQYDGNSKIAAAENAIADAATNKDKVNTMVSSAFNLAKSIKACFETNENSIVIQSFLGTVVNVGNGGTFVSYGGNYYGYGMTPNIRNGVVETTQKGKVYVFDGLFEGRCGANIFNIVKTNNSLQTVTQYVEGTDGNVTEHQAKMRQDETNGLQVLTMVNKTDEQGNIVYENGSPVKVPVSTENIRVRGGTFRCYYEGIMVGLHKDTKEGANDHNSDQMTVFPGSAGGVNLGVESYNEDLIRDGRIQLVDSYGDGALVLMDDNKDAGDNSVFHYRLFCTDEELRKNRYLTVYPNEPGSNSTFSFSLQTRYDNQDSGTYEDVSKFWSDSSENDRGVFSSDEKYFTYPINNAKYSEKYYVIPYLTNTDVFGEKLDASEVWYYNTPTDTRGRMINSFVDGEIKVSGTKKVNDETAALTYSQKYLSDADWKKVENRFISGSSHAYDETYNYRNNVKWITYKVYRVDPLTRMNITNIYGADQPVVTVRYGASTDNALKCRLPLNDLGIDYQAGEMYRVVMNVDEYLTYNGTDTSLGTASCESSIVFMCYDKDEYKIEDGEKVEDFTPVQWISTPWSGLNATVQIVNGQAGLIDYQKRKIFDVYYQWYEVNPDGEDILIAGTDNIFTKKKDTFTADLAALNKHNFSQMLPGVDGYKYVNTVDPDDPAASTYGENGLPADTDKWTVQMLHSYLEKDTPNEMLCKKKDNNLSLLNNRTMATNTDSCYIPESLEGKEIYVKVTAVNSFWLRNYDHVQVFYSHPFKVPVKTKPLEAAVSLSYSGDYATYKNPITVRLSDVKNLDPDEKITKVEFESNGGGESVVFDNLSVASADSVKAVTYPKDFFPDSVNSKGRARQNMAFYADIYTSKGRHFRTPSQVADFEVEAESIDFTYDNGGSSCNYEGAWHLNDSVWQNELRIQIEPKNSSIGGELIDGVTFTSSNPDVATFNASGKLVTGNAEGTAIVTVNQPDGSVKTQKIVKPISKISVSGIDAPVADQPLDTTAVVPDGAGYHVKQVYWTENSKWSDPLPAGYKAKAYRKYFVHVAAEENNGQEFMTTDYTSWYADGYAHVIDIPYELTAVMNDSTENTSEGRIFVDEAYRAGTAHSVEISSGFDAYSEEGSELIDTIVVNFPAQVKAGDSIDEWKNSVEIMTAAGENITKKINMGESARYGDIRGSYGYSGDMKIFLEGGQTGFNISLNIPSELSLHFPGSNNFLTIIVNGDDSVKAEMLDSKNCLIGLSDCIDIQPGTVNPTPVFDVNNVYMVVGETINAGDLLISENSSLSFDRADDYSGTYYDYNAATNTITAKKATGSNVSTFTGRVLCDANNDGINETPVSRTIRVHIYDSDSELPSNDTAEASATVLKPDGTEAFSTVRTLSLEQARTGTAYIYKYFSIPETEGTFISGAESSNSHLSYSNGLNRLYTWDIFDDCSFTIHTVSVEDIEISAGVDEVRADFEGNVFGLQLSVDGNHFYTGGYVDGLEPNTEYTLYYRQGVDGTVYNRQFRTASTDYGVNVGKVRVTELNKGDLDRDGWHYDADTDTLTLKNLDLTSVGLPVEKENGLGYSMTLKEAVIASDHALNIVLIGDNKINMQSGSAWLSCGIYADGELTISGNGDLSIFGWSNDTLMTRGIFSNSSDIRLKSTGTVSFEKIAYGISLENKDNTIYYYNGEYMFKPLNMHISGDTYLINGALVSSDLNFNADNKVHSIRVFTGENGFDETEASAEEQISIIKTNQRFTHIIPAHTCTKQVKSSEYLVSGSCDKGATYYKSCSCGHASESLTFTTAAGSHHIVHIAAVEPTCVEDGHTAYDYCTYCDHKTGGEIIPASGHSFVHHEAKPATCTENGYDAYDECTECGLSTYHVIPASGHSIVHHTAKAPTCTETGWDEYDTCENCDYTTYNELPKTEHHLEHHEGKAATENESGWEPYDECTECSYSTYKIIPALKKLTNTSTISATAVNKNTEVTINASAEGGSAPYTYAMMYKLSTSNTWKVIGKKYGTESTGTFTPASAGTYEILVSVKDNAGKTAAKKFSLAVEEAAAELKNVSSINAADVLCGTKMTITGAAEGGNAPYYYTYQIKKPGKTSWTTLGEKYGTVTSKVFTAKLPGTYAVRVLIKDSSGKVKNYSVSVNVTGTLLVNKSKVSATTVNTGDSVKLTAVPSGGTAPYRYTYEYKKPGATSWKTIGKRGATYQSVSFTAETAGTYEARIYIQDASDYVTVKTFKITAS